VAYKKPTGEEKVVSLDQHAAVITEDDLELVFGKIYSFSISAVCNGLLQIDPQFNTSIVVRVSTSKPQDVMGGGHAWVCTALLYAHDIESKLLHLGKQKV